MTPDELNEIREQHIPFEMPDKEILCEWCVDPWPCDAVDLLAEVDRLTALVRESVRMLGVQYDGGQSDERVRIHNAMLELDWTGCGGWGCAENMNDLYQTVLTVIDEGAR
jgi:hypothetical protein